MPKSKYKFVKKTVVRNDGLRITYPYPVKEKDNA